MTINHETLALDGLEIAPPQLLGNVRLFPVLNPDPGNNLRMGLRRNERSGWESISGLPGGGTKRTYHSYVPHGMVVSWRNSSQAEVTVGAELGTVKSRRAGKRVDVYHRMVQREANDRLRFLPLHLAMEGFLSLHFNGPSIAWTDYSRLVRKQSLGHRSEFAVPADAIAGLTEALRLFEIHENQVGVLVFVADALASAFITSHPDDYFMLHDSLLFDFFGELLFYYGLNETAADITLGFDLDNVDTLADLEAACEKARVDWHAAGAFMSAGLFDRPTTLRPVYRLGPFRLETFHTELDEDREAHIGEVIRGEDDRIEYLKTFRLSKRQVLRAMILEHLDAHDWEFERAARALGIDRHALMRRLDRVGLGYIINQELLAQAKRALRR